MSTENNSNRGKIEKSHQKLTWTGLNVSKIGLNHGELGEICTKLT
jgi:hypothetical protein